MKLIGLTGGIASGKSAVAALIAGLGVPVLDADQLSRRVVEPGLPAHGEIARRWPQVLLPDGRIDRARLGAVVFADHAQLAELSAIVVPRLLEEFRREARRLELLGHRFCVLEGATLFEEGLDPLFSGVLVVSAPAQEQIARLAARNGYSEEQARQRLAAQMPLEEKLRRARWIVENTGSLAELEARVRELWARIEREA